MCFRVVTITSLCRSSFCAELWLQAVGAGDRARDSLSPSGLFRVFGVVTFFWFANKNGQLSYSSTLFVLPVLQILESAVVGVPDDVLGEKVLAILVLRPDAAGERCLLLFVVKCCVKGLLSLCTPSPQLISLSLMSNHIPSISLHSLTASAGAADLFAAQKDVKQLRQALKDYLQDKLAAYKQPREYLVVDAIPRNHMGKVSGAVCMCGFINTSSCISFVFSARYGP